MSGPAIRSIRPNLEVSDVEESCRFFSAILGLEVIQSVGEPATFAILGDPRDGGFGDVVAVVAMDEQAVADVTAMYVEVDSIEATHDRALEEGFALAQPPTTHPWGLRDLVVVHPDGHLIAIGERLDTDE